MEKKIKHRILGILVMMGLVIILFPLFQTANDSSEKSILAQTPAFPNQLTKSEPIQPEILENFSTQIMTTAETQEIKPKDLNIKTQLSDSRITKTQTISDVKLSSKTLKTIPTNDKGLIKLKSTVWVLQVGSYKNRENALRIVNQLRLNGYRAFIQQISTTLGEHTRVLIGPEYKRTTALALAYRLHSELHMPSIVVSYKPLTL